MSWISNAMMYWSDDQVTWNKVSDHNRQPLNVNVTRIGSDNRMVNGTLRRYSIAKKRQFTTSWDNLPSKQAPGNGGLGTADNGFAGEDIEAWHNAHDGSFWVKFRKGTDDGKAANDATIETIKVMISDFSKEVLKRGANVDLWSVSITLEEV